MSVVIALRYRDGVMIAADKQVTVGNVKNDNISKLKLYPYSQTVLGAVGYSRDGDLLQVQDEIVAYRDILDGVNIDSSYVIRSIVPLIFDILRSNRRLITNEEGEMSRSVFLYATNEKIFKICNDGGVIEYEDFCAIGCGEQLAHGCLSTKKTDNLSKQEAKLLLTTCIKKACKDDIFINDKIDFLYLER